MRLQITLLKYLLVGALNTLFTFIIFTLLLWFSPSHYAFALTIAWILGVVLTYFLNFVWVFKPERTFKFHKRFLQYFVTSLIFFSINLLVLCCLVQMKIAQPFVAQLVIMPVLVLCNFTFTRLWSMKRTVWN